MCLTWLYSLSEHLRENATICDKTERNRTEHEQYKQLSFVTFVRTTGTNSHIFHRLVIKVRSSDGANVNVQRRKSPHYGFESVWDLCLWEVSLRTSAMRFWCDERVMAKWLKPNSTQRLIEVIPLFVAPPIISTNTTKVTLPSNTISRLRIYLVYILLVYDRLYWYFCTLFFIPYSL